MSLKKLLKALKGVSDAIESSQRSREQVAKNNIKMTVQIQKPAPTANRQQLNIESGEQKDVAQNTNKPRKRRRTKEEMIEHRRRKATELRDKNRELSKRERAEQKKIGITHYEWSTAGDERVCSKCKKNDGKIFSWDNPPENGHPGECECEGEGFCRCIAIPVFD